MMMIMDDDLAKPETGGLAAGWSASVMGMITLVRVLPEDEGSSRHTMTINTESKTAATLRKVKYENKYHSIPFNRFCPDCLVSVRGDQFSIRARRPQTRPRRSSFRRQQSRRSGDGGSVTIKRRIISG
jgi:hypothetical protein